MKEKERASEVLVISEVEEGELAKRVEGWKKERAAHLLSITAVYEQHLKEQTELAHPHDSYRDLSWHQRLRHALETLKEGAGLSEEWHEVQKEWKERLGATDDIDRKPQESLPGSTNIVRPPVQRLESTSSGVPRKNSIW